MLLSVFHDVPASESYYAGLERERLLDRLRALDDAVRCKGLNALDPARNQLAGMASVRNSRGQVRRYGLGVFSLSWQAEEFLEWPGKVAHELDQIRAVIKEEQRASLRYVIWVGTAEWTADKLAYTSTGLLRRMPRCYVLDSMDPSKMKAILSDVVRRSDLRLADALRGTLVVGTSVGKSATAPVMTMERLAALYEHYKVDTKPNMLCMTVAGSSLERFAAAYGLRTIEPQLDGAHSIAARHSAPLTRGSLYSLGFSKVDLTEWIAGTFLTRREVDAAWRLAAFLHAQAESGHGKLTLVLPPNWEGVGIWTKHVIEDTPDAESGGIRVILENKIRLANYRSPKDADQDRSFLAVRMKGAPPENPDKIALLRRRGYPIACLTLPKGAVLSRYMQFIHYTTFGLAHLRHGEFISSAGGGPYRTIVKGLLEEPKPGSGMDRTSAWQTMTSSPRRARHRDSLKLFWHLLEMDIDTKGMDAPMLYAAFVKQLTTSRSVDQAELTYFGDTRYSSRGKALLKALHRSAERVYRSRLKMAVDVCEGPVMSATCLASNLKRRNCFATLILSEKIEKLAAAGHNANYHVAQFLATQRLLADRGSPSVVITLKDLEEPSIASLEDFFRQVATSLRKV